MWRFLDIHVTNEWKESTGNAGNKKKEEYCTK